MSRCLIGSDNYLQLSEELRSARLGDGPKVVDQVRLGHAQAGIGDVQHMVLLGWVEVDIKKINMMQVCL